MGSGRSSVPPVAIGVSDPGSVHRAGWGDAKRKTANPKSGQG